MIKIKTPEPSYTWTPEQKEKLVLWEKKARDQTFDSSDSQEIAALHAQLLADKESNPQNLQAGIDTLNMLAHAGQNQKLVHATEARDRLNSQTSQLPVLGGLNLNTLMSEWYGKNAEKLKALPGMKAVNVEKPVPALFYSHLPEYAAAAYLPQNETVLYGPYAFTHPKEEPKVTAHELGHATMDRAGDADAVTMFPNWQRALREVDDTKLSSYPDASKYVLGSRVHNDPAELAAILLEYVRSNKGTHPMLSKGGVEKGVDALLASMGKQTEDSDSGIMAKVVSGIVKQAPYLKKDLVKFFQQYAEAPAVTTDGQRYTLPQTQEMT